jgi:hypothetical protein
MRPRLASDGWRKLAAPTYAIPVGYGEVRELPADLTVARIDQEAGTLLDGLPEGTVVLEVDDPARHSWGSTFWYVAEAALEFKEATS